MAELLATTQTDIHLKKLDQLYREGKLTIVSYPIEDIQGVICDLTEKVLPDDVVSHLPDFLYSFDTQEPSDIYPFFTIDPKKPFRSIDDALAVAVIQSEIVDLAFLRTDSQNNLRAIQTTYQAVYDDEDSEKKMELARVLISSSGPYPLGQKRPISGELFTPKMLKLSDHDSRYIIYPNFHKHGFITTMTENAFGVKPNLQSNWTTISRKTFDWNISFPRYLAVPK